jgi:hypothetical protein
MRRGLVLLGILLAVLPAGALQKVTVQQLQEHLDARRKASDKKVAETDQRRAAW